MASWAQLEKAAAGKPESAGGLNLGPIKEILALNGASTEGTGPVIRQTLGALLMTGSVRISPTQILTSGPTPTQYREPKPAPRPTPRPTPTQYREPKPTPRPAPTQYREPKPTPTYGGPTSPVVRKAGRLSAGDYSRKFPNSIGDVCDIRGDGHLKCLVLKSNGVPYWADYSPNSKIQGPCGPHPWRERCRA